MENSTLKIFKNNEFQVRTIEDNGEIWFVAKDVAEALGYDIDNAVQSVLNSVC